MIFKKKGGLGDDLIVGSDGNDSLYGNKGDDQPTKGSGDDYLSGHNGDDTLSGGSGNDAISSGRGNDCLLDDGIGDGNGFVFERNGGFDTIPFFADGFDAMDFRSFDFGLASGTLKAMASDTPTGPLIDLTSVGGGYVMVNYFHLANFDVPDVLMH